MSEYAEMIDEEDYTYERVQYAQVGQCHNLGDEVRELRTTNGLLKQMNEGHVEKIRKLESEVHYWRDQYTWLRTSVDRIFCHYGWGGSDEDVHGKIRRVIDDIEGLRARVRELKGRK